LPSYSGGDVRERPAPTGRVHRGEPGSLASRFVRASTTALSIATVFGAFFATPAAAARRCAVDGRHIRGVSRSHVIRITRGVVVFRTFGAERDTMWACDRSANRFVVLGLDEGRQQAESEYAPEHVVKGIEVAGRWVLAIEEVGGEGASSCSKYQAWPCPGVEVNLVLAQVARGIRRVVATIESYATDANGNVVGMVWRRTLLSAEGGVAWVQTTAPGVAPTRVALFGCAASVHRSKVSCATRVVAEDDLAVGSVRLAHLTLSWMDHTGSHAAILTP
jgi:hypothetical protein